MTLDVAPIPFIIVVVGMCFAVFESGRTFQVNKMVDQCKMLDEWERQLKDRASDAEVPHER